MNHKSQFYQMIHGNTTALEAVIADAKIKESVNTGFWEIFFFLGREQMTWWLF